jgi:hypothetical protein
MDLSRVLLYSSMTVLLQPKAVPVESASTAYYRTMILADLTVVVNEAREPQITKFEFTGRTDRRCCHCTSDDENNWTPLYSEY